VQLSGTPEDIRSLLQAFQQAGEDYVLLHFAVETQAERERAMQTFSKEVMPAVGY
jgi:alkanesulfonate monooxygenase SsuD/methylene tetrahydromethanopterin reductase-like flavin-dependent oxidoreductase (luciferase family)